MKKKFIIIFIVFLSIFSNVINADATFENNFLNGYLDFENFFIQLDGDYGMTFFPFLNSGYGGREAAFAGAFTAVADDISSLESNPAATSVLDTTELFLSHNKLFGDVNYNALAYSMRLNNLGFGIGARVLYFPFTHYDKYGLTVSSGIISYSVITMNASYNFLRSYQHFGLAAGGNIKLYIYHIPEEIAESQSRVNASFDLGLLTRFNFLKAYHMREKNFSIGFSVKNLGAFTDNDPPPTTLSFGISYKPISQFMIATDFSYLINYSEETYKNWSASFALEWIFIKQASLTAGFKLKSNPSFALGLNLNFENFRITAAYTPDFVDVSQFKISATLKLGDLGRKKFIEDIEKSYTKAMNQINNGEHEIAKSLLENILKKYPHFNPAKSTLEYVNKHINLIKNVDEQIKSNERLFE